MVLKLGLTPDLIPETFWHHGPSQVRLIWRVFGAFYLPALIRNSAFIEADFSEPPGGTVSSSGAN